MENLAIPLEKVSAINDNVPHMPKQLLHEILADEPPLAKDILPILALLPSKGEPSETLLSIAAISQLIGYSRLIHAMVANDDTPESQKAVLLGDLLSSAAYQMMVSIRQDKNLEEFADIIAQREEGWFLRQKGPRKMKAKDALEILDKEYGLLYGKVGAMGAELANLPPEAQANYQKVCRWLGILWGVIISHDPVSCDNIIAAIDQSAAKQEPYLNERIKTLKEEILAAEK